MAADPSLNCTATDERLELAPAGAWITAHSQALERLVTAATPQGSAARKVAIDMQGVHDLDTLGAWLLEKLIRAGGDRRTEAQVSGLPERYRGLLEQVHAVNRRTAARPEHKNKLLAALELAGHAAVSLRAELTTFLQMLAALSIALAHVLVHPRKFRFTSMVHHVFRVGWQAIPIVALITFLIGCIISQQGFFHFRKFGADAYVADMVGILVLRELGVLIVAIMVAGRSGSAYTAELGSMKMREEIDALRTMGFDPVEVLILPRVIALVVALPILAFLGSMAALYGGGLVAWLYGD